MVARTKYPGVYTYTRIYMYIAPSTSLLSKIKHNVRNIRLTLDYVKTVQ